MAKKKVDSKKIRSDIEASNTAAKLNIELLNQELGQLNTIHDVRKKIALQEKIIQENRVMQQNTLQIISAHQSKGATIHGKTLKNIKEEINQHGKIANSLQKEINQQKEILETEKKRIKSRTDLNALLKQGNNLLVKGGKSIYSYLMKSDTAMKAVSLELGLSGERAAILSNSFEQSAGFAAQMGVDMEGLTQMASLYAEETGRARLHNEANLKSMTLIAKGTNLGVEGAARMAAQYEMMGMNATDTATEVQRIVDTTERMGVNTSKVLKAVNKNFKALQKYNFKGGVQGMADMAIYAEKFKVSMESVFEPMEKGRRLDSVIQMSAELQVLGGQFANLADPMSMLFESRNDPEAYLKRINEMTKGMVVMNKTADGFNLEIASPMAQDQLRQAAKALGMTTDELTTQAFRMREIQQTRSQMFTKGFTKDEKNIIEGLAKFNSTTGRMMVEIGGVATDVSKLNSNQIKGLKQEQITLDERAKASQSFDQAFKNTIMELKAAFLPLLKGINSTLKAIRPIVESITSAFGESSGLMYGATALMSAGLLWKGIIVPLKNFGKLATSAIGGVGGVGGGAAKGVSKGAGGMAKSIGGKAAGGAAKGGGMLKAGAGIGMAAVGIGAGVGVAAVGISKLADSMAKLTPEQAETLESIATTLAIAMPVAALGIGILAAVAAPAALPLLALGAAILGIGAGIGVAAAGIGYMAEGMSNLDKVDLSGAGDGMLKIGAAGLMLGNPMGLIGMAAMTASVIGIGSSADDLERVGNAFGNIGAVLKGNASQFKEVKDTIQAIASTEVGSNSAIAQLTNMLSKPLRVEFADKEIGFVANIDLSMGDNNFITEISKKIPARIVDLSQAKA